MADFYCDISAVGNEYQSYADAMVWGAGVNDKPLPQDGSGLAGPGHSAAVAIAELQITVLPANGNTLTIAGAVLTAATSAAAKNQWTISGAISTCVTALVSLINTPGTGTAQCDAAVSTSACAFALALPRWCFARVKPGTTDTLQIATRIAGNDLNHAVNSAVAITSSGWGTPPTITQFAGGANGPFAYLLNTTTVFGQPDYQTTSGEAPGYGLLFRAAPGPSNPGMADVVHLRTKRSGVDLATPIWSLNNINVVTRDWSSRYYLADDGTVWSGDNGRLTITLRKIFNSSNTFSPRANSSVGFEARAKGGLEFAVSNRAGTGGINLFGRTTNSNLLFKGCRFIEEVGHTNLVNFTLPTGNITSNIDLTDSYFLFRGGMSSARYIYSNNGAASAITNLRLNGAEIEIEAAAGPIGAIFAMGGTRSTFEWIGGAVRDSLGVYRCENPLASGATYHDILIDSVDGVTDPTYGFTSDISSHQGRLAWSNTEGSPRAFRLSTSRFTLDWKDDGTFPYALATDMRGVPYSHRVTWTGAPQAYTAVSPIKISTFYRGAAAAKTIKLCLYVPDATTMYEGEFDVQVIYIDSGGFKRIESATEARLLQFSSARSALASDSTSWTANGVASHSAKKIEMTTAHSIKQNSEVVVRVGLAASRSPSVTFYISPEPVLS